VTILDSVKTETGDLTAVPTGSSRERSSDPSGSSRERSSDPSGSSRERSSVAIALDDQYAAHNYSPLPVVAASAEGVWITDVEGRRYLDCLAAYSAVNFGHTNPEVIATAHAQLDAVTLVSRAFHSDKLGPFCAALAELCGKDMVLPMNSGAEAV
jgi:ornithine--oxo-acid transaminase